MNSEPGQQAAASSTTSPVDPERMAARVALAYLFLAGGWILLSDLWVYLFIDREQAPFALQSGKGLLFVVVTGVILWRYLLLQFRVIRTGQDLLYQELARRREVEERLRRQKEENEHLAAFPERNPNPVLELQADGTVHYANRAARTLARTYTDGDCRRLLGDSLLAAVRKFLEVPKEALDLEFPIGERYFSWTMAPCQANTVLCYAREITARVHARKKMEEDEARYRILVEQSRDAIFLYDLEGRICEANPQACASLGYSRAELLGKRYDEIVSTITPEEAQRLWDRLNREPAVTVEGTYHRKDGSTFPVEVLVGLVTSTAGTLVLVSARDISDRRAAEQRLRILSRAVDQSPVSVVITNPRGDIEYVNPQFTRLTGYAVAEVLGKNPRILKSGHQTEEIYQDLWTTIIEGGEWRGELLNRKKNGDFYWESASISPVKDDLGVTTHYVAVKEDITARKLLEQTLRESEERYRLIFESAQDALFLLDEDTLTDCNTRAQEIFGRSREDLVGRTPLELSPRFMAGTESVESLAGQRIQAALEGRPQVFEWVHVRGDGQLFDCEVNLNRFVFRGKPYLLAIVRDITDRKKADTALRESEERLRLALDSARMGIFDWSVETDTIKWSWPHHRLEGRTADLNLSGFQRFLEGVHPDDRTDLTRAIDAARSDGESFLCEFRIAWAGDFRWVAVHGRFSFDGEQRRSHLHGVMQDITQRRENEERLQRALKERESLLREIHHRVKNNLQIVSSLLYLQSRKIEDPVLLTLLRESTDRIRSMALLHENLYRAGDLARIDLGKHIADLCRHLFDAYGADPARILLEMDLPSVHLDLDRAVPLGLLLNELVVNALKYAFPEGRKGTLRVQQRLTDQGELEIQVADDGVGMPQEIDPKNPETTGLQLVRSLTGQLRATLEVSREQGTLYTILVPYVTGPGPR